MATHVVSEASMKGTKRSWLPLLVGLALVAMVGVAFAAGRGSANPTQVKAPVQGNVGSQFTGMMPWMQAHADDIRWMQAHMGNVAWIRGHQAQWQWMQGHVNDLAWMQSHPTQWKWMQTHVKDIGWMHDHWGAWHQWRSGSGSGTGNGGHYQGGTHSSGWNW